MKTRTLLLLALGCGLAILLAGGALLVKLAGQDDPEPPVALGVESSIGDMRVTVLSAAEQPETDTLTVELVLGGVDDPDGAAGFELIASGPADPTRRCLDVRRDDGRDPAVHARVRRVDRRRRVAGAAVSARRRPGALGRAGSTMTSVTADARNGDVGVGRYGE